MTASAVAAVWLCVGEATAAVRADVAVDLAHAIRRGRSIDPLPLLSGGTAEVRSLPDSWSVAVSVCGAETVLTHAEALRLADDLVACA